MAVHHTKDREKLENTITTGHFGLVSLRKTRAVKSHYTSDVVVFSLKSVFK